MKRICNLCIGMGILMTIIYGIMNNETFSIIMFIIPYIVAALELAKCVKENCMFPITTLLVWITLYNLLYFILKLQNVADLYNIDGRIPIQFVFPIFLGSILQYRYEKNYLFQN